MLSLSRTNKTMTGGTKRYVIWGGKKETCGHMLLVALIPRYKKRVHERTREKGQPSHKNNREKKRIRES